MEGQDYAHELLDQYRDTIGSLTKNGKNVVVVLPVPEAGWSVPIEMAKRLHLKRASVGFDLDTSYEAYRDRNVTVLDTFATFEDTKQVILVDPAEVLCDRVSMRCLNSIGGVPLYYDDDHLSLFGSRMLTEKLFTI